MGRLRTLLTCLTVLAVGASIAVVGQSDDVNKRIEALEKQIATLERTIQTRLAAIEQKLAQSGGGAAAANAQAEQEARALYSKANQLMVQGKTDEAKAELTTLLQKYPQTRTARSALQKKKELDVVGKSAPSSWGIEKWYQGESDVDLASDKATLIVFWEVWCPHCKREVPKLEQIYTSLKGDGLQVVGLTRVSKSATEEKVVDFMSETKVSYPMAKENGSVASHFAVSGIPAAAVIKDGKVVWRGHPATLSEAQLKSWLQ